LLWGVVVHGPYYDLLPRRLSVRLLSGDLFRRRLLSEIFGRCAHVPARHVVCAEVKNTRLRRWQKMADMIAEIKAGETM
jgi:hypothetical protein